MDAAADDKPEISDDTAHQISVGTFLFPLDMRTPGLFLLSIFCYININFQILGIKLASSSQPGSTAHTF
jgi:hypothetical protein